MGIHAGDLEIHVSTGSVLGSSQTKHATFLLSLVIGGKALHPCRCHRAHRGESRPAQFTRGRHTTCDNYRGRHLRDPHTPPPSRPTVSETRATVPETRAIHERPSHHMRLLSRPPPPTPTPLPAPPSHHATVSVKSSRDPRATLWVRVKSVQGNDWHRKNIQTSVRLSAVSLIPRCGCYSVRSCAGLRGKVRRVRLLRRGEGQIGAGGSASLWSYFSLIAFPLIFCS
jgi:hypothetical protein